MNLLRKIENKYNIGGIKLVVFSIFDKIVFNIFFLKKIWMNYCSKCSNKKREKILFYYYQNKTHKTLDWNNLCSYSEKMQWAKLYELSEKKTMLTDKITVRNWVKEKIGAEYLIPILKIWDNAKDISFEDLPSKFILKTNHASNCNICITNKYDTNINIVKRKINKFLKINLAYEKLEMQYENIIPKVYAEEYIEDSKGKLIDYKFICFDGKPYYCWIDLDRYTNHTRAIYNMNWERQNCFISFANSETDIDKPKNFDLMVNISKKLSEGFSHVRVDLYNVDGKIYFGEMTFTSGSGFQKIIPEEFDYHLGELWKLNIQKSEHYGD